MYRPAISEQDIGFPLWRIVHTGTLPIIMNPAHTSHDAPASYEVDGRTVTLPVRIRHARQWSASWLVPARAAQTVIDYSELEVIQPIPGKAVLALAFVDYLDGDLDSYHEVAMSILVRRHDAPPVANATAHTRELARGQVAAFIHDLPVDQEFTRQAGTQIWGYPKWITEIDIEAESKRTRCRVRSEHGHELTLSIPDGGPLPLPMQMPPTYSWREGVLRMINWELTSTGGGARLGGARLTIGDNGPIATTLRRLRVPRRSVMSAFAPHVALVFGAPEIVSVGH